MKFRRFNIVEFLRFIFSSFWVWLGFAVLVYIVMYGLKEIIKACQKVKAICVYEGPTGRSVEVRNIDEDKIQQEFTDALNRMGKEQESE